MHDEGKEQRASSAETWGVVVGDGEVVDVEVDPEGGWKPLGDKYTAEEIRAAAMKFMEEVFRSQCVKLPTFPNLPPTPPPPAAISVSSSGPVTIPAGTKVAARFQPQSYTAVDFGVNVHQMWWETVRDEFADLLPDEEAAIVMLGGNRCPQLGIVRTGRRTYRVHHRGSSVADITDIVSRNVYMHTLVRDRIDTHDMVARAQWLAEHLGCSYGREKPQRTWRKLTRRARQRLGLGR
jgi:hypothetical protein